MPKCQEPPAEASGVDKPRGIPKCVWFLSMLGNPALPQRAEASGFRAGVSDI